MAVSTTHTPSRDRQRVAGRLRAAGLDVEGRNVCVRIGYYRRIRDLPRWWADAYRGNDRVTVESYLRLAEAARTPLKLVGGGHAGGIPVLLAERAS